MSLCYLTYGFSGDSAPSDVYGDVLQADSTLIPEPTESSLSAETCANGVMRI